MSIFAHLAGKLFKAKPETLLWFGRGAADFGPVLR
jgi:hypothetical protein